MSGETVGIREERAGDAPRIQALHRAEFRGNAEADLLNRLWEDGDVVLSLVAEEDGNIVGHILYSRLTVDGVAKASALGPIYVDVPHQNRAVGAHLIEAGIRMLRERGEALIFVIGDPVYYRRFGFSIAEGAKFRTPYDGPYMMCMRLAADAPAAGEVVYPAAYVKLG